VRRGRTSRASARNARASTEAPARTGRDREEHEGEEGVRSPYRHVALFVCSRRLLMRARSASMRRRRGRALARPYLAMPPKAAKRALRRAISEHLECELRTKQRHAGAGRRGRVSEASELRRRPPARSQRGRRELEHNASVATLPVDCGPKGR